MIGSRAIITGGLITGFLFLFLVVPAEAAYKATQAESFAAKANVGIGAEEMTVEQAGGKAAKLALGMVGLIFFVLVFYGGFLWFTAQGKEEQIDKARGTIIAASIGLVLTVSSYAITNFVMTRLVEGQKAGALSGESTGVAGEEGTGCCLEAYRVPGNLPMEGIEEIPLIGDPIAAASEIHPIHWRGLITTAADCEEIGYNCDDQDELCGQAYYEFVEGVASSGKCEAAAEMQEEDSQSGWEYLIGKD
ncbi:MAG TPA: hypothetical protein VJB37_00535 [Patescibacteria group bacterium]|nr:hypothetical protein [Patescibacteria group bacterium]